LVAKPLLTGQKVKIAWNIFFIVINK